MLLSQPLQGVPAGAIPSRVFPSSTAGKASPLPRAPLSFTILREVARLRGLAPSKSPLLTDVVADNRQPVALMGFRVCRAPHHPEGRHGLMSVWLVWPKPPEPDVGMTVTPPAPCSATPKCDVLVGAELPGGLPRGRVSARRPALTHRLLCAHRSANSVARPRTTPSSRRLTLAVRSVSAQRHRSVASHRFRASRCRVASGRSPQVLVGPIGTVPALAWSPNRIRGTGKPLPPPRFSSRSVPERHPRDARVAGRSLQLDCVRVAPQVSG